MAIVLLSSSSVAVAALSVVIVALMPIVVSRPSLRRIVGMLLVALVLSVSLAYAGPTPTTTTGPRCDPFWIIFWICVPV